MGDFHAAYPGYAATARVDELRAVEYGYLDEGGHVYLDYTGAGLPARSQLRAHASRMLRGVYGNPHSDNPTSSASTALVEQTRAAVLRYFNASADEYAVIFTPNATGACHLVGESYPFGRRSRLILTADNHNSVNGLREYAAKGGAHVAYVGMNGSDLRISERAPGCSPTRPSPTSAAPVIRCPGWHARRQPGTTCCSTRPPSCRLADSTCPRYDPSSWR